LSDKTITVVSDCNNANFVVGNRSNRRASGCVRPGQPADCRLQHQPGNGPLASEVGPTKPKKPNPP